jgi:hypothetical protein
MILMKKRIAVLMVAVALCSASLPVSRSEAFLSPPNALFQNVLIELSARGAEQCGEKGMKVASYLRKMKVPPLWSLWGDPRCY